MSDKQNINRDQMIKVANLVKPALSTANYIPALNHIQFDDKYATAYNDISAISVLIETGVTACIPGDVLIRALNSFSSENLMFQLTDSEAIISSGRSKLKLPILPVDDFPLKWPDEKKAVEIALDANIIKGIERCLVSVGSDPTHPAQMGVTLDVDDKGRAVLFSTDNATISRYQTPTKLKLPGDAPVILPTFFCQQLLALAKAYPEEDLDLMCSPGAVVANFGKYATLLTKTPVDVEPLDFHKIIRKHVPKLDELGEIVSPLPDSWDAAFSRALLVVSGDDDKSTKITITSSSFKMLTTSAMGESSDSLEFDAEEFPDSPFYVDPSLVARGSKFCTNAYFGSAAMVMTDEGHKDGKGFLHLIAHCSK